MPKHSGKEIHVWLYLYDVKILVKHLRQDFVIVVVKRLKTGAVGKTSLFCFFGGLLKDKVNKKQYIT